MMHTIKISVQRDRSLSDELSLLDPAGELILGPFPAAYLVEETEISRWGAVGNSDDTVFSEEFEVADILSIEGGTADDVRAFGRYGIITLQVVGIEGDKKESHLQSAPVYIHGGMLSGDILQTPETPRTLRLRPQHHRQLVMSLRRLPTPAVCRFVLADGNQTSERVDFRIQQGQPRISLATQLARFASAALLMGTPLLLTAQGSCGGGGYDNGCSFFGDCPPQIGLNEIQHGERGTAYAGYVPNDNSGVSIAHGLDLGKNTSQDLLDMGFNAEMVKKFQPYLAGSDGDLVVGSRARRLLASTPLSLTPEQAEEVSRLVHTWHANSVGSLFNREVSRQGILRGVTFSGLPVHLQSAMTKMYIANRDFAQSDAFIRFAGGHWSPDLLAAAEQHASYSAVDFRYLEAREGGMKYVGYVPDDNSGVNIAVGLDLGKTTPGGLLRMGFSTALVSLLSPYLASSETDYVVGPKARGILAASPLTVTFQQADEIKRRVFSWYAHTIGVFFNSEVANRGLLEGVIFAGLPAQFQTTLTNMFLTDRQFPASAAFARFAKGQWSAGLLGLNDYPSADPAVVLRAKESAVYLSGCVARLPLPKYGTSFA